MVERAVAFGPYEVLGRLATGGSAHIFLARQPRLEIDRLVCLKVLVPALAQDVQFVEALFSEAKLAARINHPNCVDIYDLGVEEDVYFISMEYILGESLAALLDTCAMPGGTSLPTIPVVSIIAAVCEGLHRAHELRAPSGEKYNLVHRDISPQNIIVSYEGHAKVLDFGIAKAEMSRHETETGIVKGKLRYMSPEQAFGRSLDHRSDIYSLGLVLFECLSAHQLFKGHSREELERAMVNKRPPRLKEIVPEADERLDAICARALELVPAMRFGSAREMGEQLRAFLQKPVVTDERGAVTRLMRERFGERITQRGKAVEEALTAKDLTALQTTLGARPVLELDLFGRHRAAAYGDSTERSDEPPDLPEDTISEVSADKTAPTQLGSDEEDDLWKEPTVTEDDPPSLAADAPEFSTASGDFGPEVATLSGEEKVAMPNPGSAGLPHLPPQPPAAMDMSTDARMAPVVGLPLVLEDRESSVPDEPEHVPSPSPQVIIRGHPGSIPPTPAKRVAPDTRPVPVLKPEPEAQPQYVTRTMALLLLVGGVLIGLMVGIPLAWYLMGS